MAEKLFYSMGEVAEMFDVKPSLLRHWESQFPVLRPKRNKKGNRLFSPQDVENLKLIYHLVKERGMTLDGARKALRQQRADKGMSRDAELMERLQHIRAMLVEVREDLKAGGGDILAADADAGEESAGTERDFGESGMDGRGRADRTDKTAGESVGSAGFASAACAETPEHGSAAGGPCATASSPAAAGSPSEGAQPRRRAKAVVKIAEESEPGADADAEGSKPSAPRAARKPRRTKKEEAEHKELFAFYEQSLF